MNILILFLTFLSNIYGAELSSDLKVLDSYIKNPKSLWSHFSTPLPHKWNFYIDDRGKPETEAEMNESPVDIPHLKFYKNKTLKGKPFAFIDKVGLKVEKEYECYVEEKITKRKGLVQKYKEGMSGTFEKDCTIIPLLVDGYEVVLFVDDVTNDVGRIKINGEVAYFDITLLNDKKKVPSTASKIRNNLGVETLKSLNNIMDKLRTAIIVGSSKNIFDLFEEDFNINKRKIDSYKKDFGKSEILSLDTRLKLLKLTYIDYLSISDRSLKKYLRKIKESNSKRVRGSLCFSNNDNQGILESSICFKKENGQRWTLGGINLNL